MKRHRVGTRRAAAALGFAVMFGLFGTAEAAAPTTPVLISVSPSTLTPYISGGCYTHILPCHKVKGHTDPGVKVTLIVRDALGGEVKTVGWSAERDDEAIGVLAGDFTFAPNVTPLGTHDTTPSLLTYTAYAEDLAGIKSPESNAIVVTKNAATANDTTPPTVTIQGGRIPNQICGTGWCNFNGCAINSIRGAIQPGTSGGCTGTYRMAGSAEDLTSASYGVASEIKSILLTTKDSAGNTVESVEGLGLRRGMQGFWSAAITVARYATGQSYTWTLVGSDAAGNLVTVASGSFQRAPL